MASETSELTFVRCPSCRSLVPTSAVRCRICNNPLDGGAKAEGGDSSRQAGRVRQKTITATAEELLQGTGLGGDDTFVESAPEGFSDSSGGDENGHEVVDPLADFLQEFEEQSAPVSAPSAPQEVAAAPIANDDEDDDLDAFLDEFDNFDPALEPINEPPFQPIAAPPVQPPPQQVTPLPIAPLTAEIDPFDLDDDPLAEFSQEVEDDFDLDQPAVQPVAVAAPPEARVIPEPPPVARQEPARQMVEKREPPPAAPPRQAHQHNNKQARPAQEQRDRGGRHNNKPATHDRRESRDHGGGANKNERRHDEQRKQHQQSHAQKAERSHEREHHRPEVQSAGPKTGKMRPGRLFGWLVSFESPDGRAIELREGKFFVTGSSIRGTDLVIEDPSISTPHALMSLSADHGLLIQDLMSERGLFVRSGDRGQYRREEGVVELKHGDWVRFGDVEFLLTVVPGGR